MYERAEQSNQRPCSSRRPIAAPSRHAASAPSGPPIVESGRTARVAGAHPGRVNRCRAHVAGQRLWVRLQTATARLPSHAKARFTGGLALFVPHPAAPPDQLPPPAAAARAAALRWSPVPPPLALAAWLFFFRVRARRVCGRVRARWRCAGAVGGGRGVCAGVCAGAVAGEACVRACVRARVRWDMGRGRGG